MKINGEEVELVTDFATLRSGMIVWIKRCRACQSDERMLLLRPCISRENEPAFFVTPLCNDEHDCVGTSTVRERRVYRVVDPKLAQTTERKRETVRP